MTEPYPAGFVPAYEEHWRTYPTRVAPELLRLHRRLAPEAERRLLDIGCGTGIVAGHFQQAGYRVTGLDTSAAMLAQARERLGAGAELIHADAADFALDQPVPFAMSTYDIPNHLAEPDRIRSYLACAYRAVRPGGLFAFDVATSRGLRGMNGIQIRETDTSILLYRGALDETAGFGVYRISGAVRAPDGRYDRFETTIRNAVVPLAPLLATLSEVGWRDSYLAATDDLVSPLAGDPEAAAEPLRRVFLVTRHPA